VPRLDEADFAELSALAARAQEGDAAVYASLLERLYPLVTAVIRARLGAVVDVDDVTQECLLAVHKSLATYHPSRSLKPWLLAIVRYKVADHFRALGRRSVLVSLNDESTVTNGGARANSACEASTDPGIDVGTLIERLPEPLRHAVALTKLQGLSGEEAARRAGISEAALRKRVSRAYKELARLAERELEREHGD
jgi:RNA polymerase sigma-70 factor, ECF subfamily